MSLIPYILMEMDVIQGLRKIEAGSIDLIFADPPYFLSNDGFTVKSGKAVSVNKGKWDKSGGYETDFKFHHDWLVESLRILKPNGTIFVSGTYHSIFQCGSIIQKLGCRIINDIVWFKPNGAPALGGRNFTASHETLIWASKNKNAKHTFNYLISKEWDVDNDRIYTKGRQMRSVWSIPTTPKREKFFGHHPTQKPLELLNRVVSLCSNVGDVVVDPFCGSGTTGVAALSAGRSFIGIDNDPNSITLSKKRLDSIIT